MSSIEIRQLRKEYGPTVAVDSLDAVFESGSVTCVLGPSGCGKTTLLRLIAGLEKPDRGSVLLAGKDVTALPTEKRDLGMVFQYPVVYRGMTVLENLELPLRQASGNHRLPHTERLARVRQLMSIMGLSDVSGQSVDSLPNGARQKVAVARAMVRRPAVVIFDEPVTNVDIVSKLEIQRDIKSLVRELGQTVLYVTHDQTEAMTLADRILLLKDGRTVESGPPRSVFPFPSSTFGGHFLGSPGMNLLPARVESAKDGRATVTSEMFAEPVPFTLTGSPSAEGNVIGVRPERILLAQQPAPGWVRAKVVTRFIGAGGRWVLTCTVGDNRVHVKARRADTAGRGNEFWIAPAAGASCLFDATGTRIGVAGADAPASNSTDTVGSVS